MGTQQKFDELPVMPVHSPPAWSSLEIRGTVGKHLDLVLNDLLLMPQPTFTADFECNDGWISPEQEWEGVPQWRALPDSDYRGGFRFHCNDSLKIEWQTFARR